MSEEDTVEMRIFDPLRRKQREWSVIADEPQTPFMVGQLLGANRLAVALLAHEQNETAQLVASVLAEVSGYFMEDVPESKGKP